jgi:plastocyanin
MATARAGVAMAGLLAVAAADVSAQTPEVRATVRGRVTVARPATGTGERPAVTSLGAPRGAEAPDRRTSVVFFETAPLGAFEEADHPPRVLDQRKQSFAPYVLAIPVGTTVRFPNNDRTYHNVFSLSKARRFDLGRYPPGESRSVRFDRPGVVRVFCEIHSHMSAFVLVFAHRYFATTDAEGRYEIGGVPPGSYNLVVWNNGAERERKAIRVPPEGGALELDFDLP